MTKKSPTKNINFTCSEKFEVLNINRHLKENQIQIMYLNVLKFYLLTDTGEDSKLVLRRKRPKVDTLFSSFFPTRPSDECDSEPSRKY